MNLEVRLDSHLEIGSLRLGRNDQEDRNHEWRRCLQIAIVSSLKDADWAVARSKRSEIVNTIRL